MKKYFLLLCLCFLAGCRSFSAPSPSASAPQNSPSVVLPGADELESITLVLIAPHARQFDLDFDPIQYQCVKLVITDPQKIQEMCRIFQEMSPRVVPWKWGLLSVPAPSRLILKRKETLLLRPNEIAEWDLCGPVGKDFSEAAVKLVTNMEFPGIERLGGEYSVEISPEGLKKLNDFLKKEFRENRSNEAVCIFVPWPGKADMSEEKTQ